MTQEDTKRKKEKSDNDVTKGKPARLIEASEKDWCLVRKEIQLKGKGPRKPRVCETAACESSHSEHVCMCVYVACGPTGLKNKYRQSSALRRAIVKMRCRRVVMAVTSCPVDVTIRIPCVVLAAPFETATVPFQKEAIYVLLPLSVGPPLPLDPSVPMG